MRMRFPFFLPLLFLFAVSLVGCRNYAMNKEYERIKASGLSGDALRAALTDFELQNMDHFASKVDLGGYYLLSGNIERALDYFRRAEVLVSKAPKNDETRKNVAILYGSLARISLLQGDYDNAMGYAQKAVTADSESGAQYRFLQAHILIAQEKQDQALALFDELYQTQQDLMAADDIRAFMYLLAKAKRFGDCAEMVDLYFEKGPFFSGLGLFASGAYENSGQANKAILAAFLEYEYNTGYTETNDRDFLENINTLEKLLVLKGLLAQTEQTVRMVRSLYDNSSLESVQKHSGFFAEDYVIFKKKILMRSLTVTEFEQYLRLERYFTRFPVYYWNVWQAALECSPDKIATFIPALEKIILLDKDGRYALPAWKELTRLMGYAKQ
jgi:tetratricopeptide (TPR) repeat protein